MKSHRTDGVSLSFGLVFLLIAGWYLAARLVDLHLATMGWSVAGGLILLGLLGLAGALRTSRTAGADGTGVPAGGEADAPTLAWPPSRPVGQEVTDAERAPVAERLRAALDDGRLSFTEYNERLQQAYTAITYEELDRVVTGLEAPTRPDNVPDDPAQH
jgi:Domain of unknown function (DUF1707)